MKRKAAYLLLSAGLLSFALIFAEVPRLTILSIAIPLLFTGILMVSLGVFRIKMSFFVDSICEISETRKWVALTFDDGPHEQTRRLLGILDEYNVKATFFCIGTEVEKFPGTVLQIINAGHSIGSHTLTHNWKYLLPGSGIVKKEIAQGIDILHKISGKKPVLFRPPFGITTPVLGKTIRSLGLKSIGWNIRTSDTMTTDGNKVISKIIKQIKPGAVILMHDRLESTVDVVPQIIGEIRKLGYEMVSMETALKTRIYV